MTFAIVAITRYAWCPRVRNTGIRAGPPRWTCPGEASVCPASRTHFFPGYGSFLRFVKKRSITDDVYQQPRPFGAVLPHRLWTVDPRLSRFWLRFWMRIPGRFHLISLQSPDDPYNRMHVEAIVKDVDGGQTRPTFTRCVRRLISLPRFDAGLGERSSMIAPVG